VTDGPDRRPVCLPAYERVWRRTVTDLAGTEVDHSVIDHASQPARMQPILVFESAL